jgi:hypothetical protein
VLSSTVRDIAIIIIAVQTIVIGVLIAVLVWQIWRLVKVIQTELMPIIEDTQATISTVRGTTTFVSNNVIDPVISTNRKIAKWRATTQVLLRELGIGGSSSRAAPPSPTTPPATPPVTPPPGAPPAPSSEPLS